MIEYKEKIIGSPNISIKQIHSCKKRDNKWETATRSGGRLFLCGAQKGVYGVLPCREENDKITWKDQNTARRDLRTAGLPPAALSRVFQA